MQTFERATSSNSRKSDEQNLAAEQVKDIIEKDSTRTVKDIAYFVDMPKTTVHRILTDDLDTDKMDPSYID